MKPQPKPHRLRRFLCSIFAVAAVGTGIGFGIHAANETVPTTADGVSYLENHGYTDVEPAGHGLISSCPKNTRPHYFTATDDNGKRGEQTLCFGLFHKIYHPVL